MSLRRNSCRFILVWWKYIPYNTNPYNLIKFWNKLHCKVDASEMMDSSVHLHVNALSRDVVMVVSTMDMTGAQIAALQMGSAIHYDFSGSIAHVFNKETGINLEA